MAGEKEKNKAKRCPLCGGEMYDGITMLSFLMGEKVAIIKNVPAEICTDCGEAYMKSHVTGKVETLLDCIEELHSEVSIIYYEAA